MLNVALALLFAIPVPAVDPPEAATSLLERWAEQPPDTWTEERPELRDVPTATRLFYMYTDYEQYVRVVRSVADVTGDGLDEIIVGIDESQSDNVFCLDGASSGLATIVWSMQPFGGLSNGSPYGDESIVPISDSDGNGYQNILVGTAWGGRSAHNIDTLDGSVLWTFDTYDDPPYQGGWVYSLAELDDITGDGVPEVVFGAGSEEDSVTMVDGASTLPGQATAIWQYQTAGAVMSVRSIGDVNGDGDHDVIAAVTGDVDEVICLDGGTSSPNGSIIWTYPTGSTVWSVGVLPDITGDGIDEAVAVLWTWNTGKSIHCLDGATGGKLWNSTEVNDYGVMVDVLEDINGDGYDELIVGSWENALIVLSGLTGEQLWKTTVGTLNNGNVQSARAIDDMSGDGRPDVIAGSFDGYVYGMDGKDGTVLWHFNTFYRVYSVYPVGDLTGDGYPEVAVGNWNRAGTIISVHVLDGGAGAGPLFADGFESGDTGAWSSTLP
jgi:outer membrane protein assembly factor BamB